MDFKQYLGEYANAQPKLTTSKGKPVSHFSMKCYFTSGARTEFTFRGDDLKDKYKVSRNWEMNELEAILYKLDTIQNTVSSCKIWNNFKSPDQQLIYSKSSDGRTSVNELAEELRILKLSSSKR